MATFDYKVEVRNRDGVLVDTLYKDGGMVLDFKWGYDRIGGCSDFEMITKHTWDEMPPYSGGYDVRFKILNNSTHVYDTWFRGIVGQVRVDLADISTSRITGRGYTSLLSTLIKTGSYTNMEVSSIVEDILVNIVCVNTDITYIPSDIVSTGYTIDEITFSSQTVLDCFQTLADIAGGYEWGVKADLNFYFKPRGTTPQVYISVGRNAQSFSRLQDYSKIINRVRIEGRKVLCLTYVNSVLISVTNTQTIVTEQDLNSQSRWGQRDKIVQNASISSTAVATKYAQSILAEQSTPAERGSLKLYRNILDSNENQPIESTLPLGKVELRKLNYRYGQKKFGQGTYGGSIYLHIQEIRYNLTDNGIEVNLVLGRYVPELALTIKQIEFEINQSRQQNTSSS